jgi:signal transduction histidine kinase
VDLIADSDCSDLSPDAALALFRVIQEALSNVIKHSGVGEAVVKVRQSRDLVTVRIEDHGCGFDSAIDGGGLGLHSMRERLTQLGGELRVQSRPGGGTTVLGRVPRTKASTAAPNYAAEGVASLPPLRRVSEGRSPNRCR